VSWGHWGLHTAADDVYHHIVEADVADDVRQVHLAMAWDEWAPRIKGGCDNGCDHDRMMMGEYSIDHTDGTGPQPSDLMPGIKGRSLLQFTHDTDEHGNPEMYVSGIHVDEGHRRDGVAEALMRRMRQDHPDTPINPGFMTDMGEGLLDGLKKRIPGAGDALVPRHAAVNRELVDRLNGEFHQWADENPHKVELPRFRPERGMVGDWQNVENFLQDRYPAAYRNHQCGMEEAAHFIDGTELPDYDDPDDYPDQTGADVTPYETGPEAVSLHGYDPREVAAGMLLLHNKSHPLRGDMAQADQDRLNDIFTKRQRMQRNYERRQQPVTASRSAAVNRELVDRLHGEFHDWWGTSKDDLYFPERNNKGMGPLGHWPNIEAFLADRYPAAHRDLDMGMEAAQPLMDGEGLFGDRVPDVPAYETGPDAIARHGYDPREVAASMLLLHNGVNPQRGDMAKPDQDRLNDIARKRFDMQRTYEDRTREAALDPHDAHQAAVRDVMHLHHYIEEGEHPDGVGSVLLHPRAHHPALTNHWAAEIIKPDPNGPGFGTRAQAATGHYVDALSGVVEGSDPGAHHQLENARNGLRVELQHAGHFSVPDLSQFSRLPRESDAMRLAAVNPRHDHGMEVPPPPRPDSPMGGKLRWLKGANARLAAYTINCQRACLALDSRHRGLNVEARPNYHNPIHDPDGTDEQWTDDEVADLWHDRHGNQPSWIDASDHFQLAAPGPAHWDAMTEHINSWGRGARALIAMTQADPTDPVNNPPFRHVIMARVGRDRKVRYVDPQIARADASDWRGRVMYGGHPLLFTAADREYAASLTDDHRVKNIVRNRLYSPLRYLRIDDARLSPHAARHLVDRGTAGGSPIHPAAPAFPDLPGAPTPPSNPARDW